MKENNNYKYRVTFIVEILANREQEYIRRKSGKDMSVEDYESEFEELDFLDAKRWIKDTTTSFYAESIDEVKKRIGKEFHNGRIDTTPLIEDGYFYWFDNNCLVDKQRLLHRGYLMVDHACDVEINNEDLAEIGCNAHGKQSINPLPLPEDPFLSC